MDAAGIDAYGMPAYTCAVDGAALAAADGSAGEVLRCPTCGHRTDDPGSGVLGDAFDVTHRQWGLRGDVHAWQALRDRVASTPTPATDAEVRASLVDAFRGVVGVDLDGPDAGPVHRPDLDHGGMSGGQVSLEWWRTKGVPLLVERAVSRRPGVVARPGPSAPTAPAAPGPAAAPADGAHRVRGRAMGVLVWLVVLAIPAALLGGGGFLLYQRAVGRHVRATVLECRTSGEIAAGTATYRTDCLARWEIDGRVVTGGFTGGNGESDVGRTVDATVRGDTAYSRSLALPVVLVVLGAPFLLLPASAVRRWIRARRA